MHVEADVRKLAAVVEELELVTEDFSREFLADYLEWDMYKLDEIWSFMENTRLASLDNPLGDEGSVSHADILVDPDQVSVEDVGIENSFASDILKALSVLPEREYKVLLMHHGLGGQEASMTLQEIGQTMGLTRERVRQLEAKAIARLRHPSSGVAWAFTESPEEV